MQRLLKVSLVLGPLVLPIPLIYLLNRTEDKVSLGDNLFILAYCWLLIGMCLAVNSKRLIDLFKMDELVAKLHKQSYYLRVVIDGSYFIFNSATRKVLKWLFFLLLVTLWGIIQWCDVFSNNVLFILTLNAYTFVGIIIYMAKLLFSSPFEQDNKIKIGPK